MKKINEEFKDVKKGDFVSLVILPSRGYREQTMDLMKILVKKNKMSGAYVAMNSPYKTISNLMKKNKIKSEDLLFVDCVSAKEQKSDNCIFLKSLESLTHIGICLEPIYKIKQHEFILLDSLNSLSAYHGKKTIIRFMRFLIEKMREHELVGVIVALDEMTDREMIGELAPLCDKVIDLTE
jgi:hypothetical protein